MSNATALNLIMRFEGFRASPYLCTAGVPTIGYGSTRYADGRRVTLTDGPISEADAIALLRLTVQRCELDMAKHCPAMLGATEGRQAAVVSFIYNMGVTQFLSSVYRRRLLARDWGDAARECQRWIFSGGKKTAGLIARREVEARLLLAG